MKVTAGLMEISEVKLLILQNGFPHGDDLEGAELLGMISFFHKFCKKSNFRCRFTGLVKWHFLDVMYSVPSSIKTMVVLRITS